MLKERAHLEFDGGNAYGKSWNRGSVYHFVVTLTLWKSLIIWELRRTVAGTLGELSCSCLV